MISSTRVKPQKEDLMTNGLFRPTDGKTDGAILAMNGRKSKKLGGLLENEADVGTEVLIFADRTGHD